MDYQRITLRIPVPLHKKLMDVSEESSKSMNAEVIARLQDSFENYDQLSQSALDAIRSIIKDELSKKK